MNKAACKITNINNRIIVNLQGRNGGGLPLYVQLPQQQPLHFGPIVLHTYLKLHMVNETDGNQSIFNLALFNIR